MPVQPPAPPYVGPAKFQGSSTNKPIKRIVIHGTVSPTVEGGARAVAEYFRSRVRRPSSAHYVADPGESVQVVWDSVVAYHAPPNEGSIGYELCDLVVDEDGEHLPLRRWNEPLHRRMLRVAAADVAALCLANDIPIRKVGPIGLRLGRRGITGHADVSKAWGLTTHTDPGNFPWRRFIAMVRCEADFLKGF